MLRYTLFRETHLYTVIFASCFFLFSCSINFFKKKSGLDRVFLLSNKSGYNAFTMESSLNLHFFSFTQILPFLQGPCLRVNISTFSRYEFGNFYQVPRLVFFSLSRNATDYASPHRCSLFRRSSCPGRTLASRGSVSPR